MKASKFIEEWGMWKGLGIKLDKKYISKVQHQKEIDKLQECISNWHNLHLKDYKEKQVLEKELEDYKEFVEDAIFLCTIENSNNIDRLRLLKELKQKGEVK